MYVDELRTRLLLLLALKRDPRVLRRLLGQHGNAAVALSAMRIDPADWCGAVERELRDTAAQGACWLMPGMPGYPSPLTDSPLLCIRGQWRSGPAVSIVGSRQADRYGTAMASALAHGLSQVGVTVVSGAARGVDEAAHRAALKAGGRTVAVLGTGLCGVRSAGKRRLLGEIASSGAVMTEYPLMARGARWTYPERNRLVASLGQATVVVQAAKKSGALITAAYSEVVFAMPGDVCYPLSAGCNALLAKGAARLFSHPRDLIPVIGQPGLASVDWPSGARSDSPQFLSPTRFLAKQGGDSPILAALRRQGPLSIASLSGYLPEIPSLGSRLLELELKQQVVRGPLGTYTIATTPG